MDKKLLAIIEKEDKKNAYTDDEIAALLNISRYEVMRLRRRLGIEDYSKRRYPILLQSIETMMKERAGISTADLTRNLLESGFHVSRFLVGNIKEQVLSKKTGEKKKDADYFKTNTIPVNTNKNNDHFNGIIGVGGSISTQLKQAKAAAIYPPSGVHTLIVGETGTGKSLLAEAMFYMGKESGIVSKDAEFVKLNCADYANNPELLCSQLFGHCKGAFTGAESNKTGLIQKADGGILFLDEIHRLPPEGQEILFSVIDNGTYRRLGQTENEEKASVMIIGATTENLHSSLLLTFTRRMPMVIELPPLMNRTIEERYQMIVKFIQNEANKTLKDITINSESLCALLLYDCKGNIGQLKSDIKVACSRAYLKNVEDNQDCIKLDITDFNPYIQDGLLRRRYSKEGIDKYCDHGIIFKPDIKEITLFSEKELLYGPQNIYEFISNKFERLREEQIPLDLIQEILAKEVDYKLNKMVRSYTEHSNQGGEELIKKDLTADNAVNRMIAVADQRLGGLYKGVDFCLRLHLLESINRIRSHNDIPQFDADAIKYKYGNEYQIASDMLALGGELLNIEFPKEEIAFIAMYLKNNPEVARITSEKVKIVIITHGNVAREISKLVNDIIGSSVTDYLCIGLEEKNDAVIEKTLNKTREIQEDNLLLLVDMGSSIALGEIITRETGKKTKTVSRVEVAMALDASIKVKNENISLDELYDYIKRKTVLTEKDQVKSRQKNKVIITLCITGQGAAMGIKEFLLDKIPEIKNQGVTVIPIGLISDHTEEYIEEIRRTNDLIAMVGTFNPNIEDIPFFAIEDLVIDNRFDRLKELVSFKMTDTVERKTIRSLVREELIQCISTETTKARILDELADALRQNGFVTDEYKENIIKREKLIDTGFVNGIAIPHTYAKYVSRSAVAIALLKEPILWGQDYYADIIIMLALTNEDGGIIKSLHKLAYNEKLLKDLRSCQTKSDAAKLLETFSLE